ncbi:unnamed protein product [Arabis nemorensis]|uniref:C3H1-type domain-containing protein n=1 Tax=Arabis nemorensis TaxID=586526 RepID=A0A565CFQ6_9BRAS|nr:unnamed protein product [Arabis nemorensis]
MEDSKAFCEFLSNRKPPRSLSESTPDDAVEFLLSLPSDRINKVVGSLSAVTFKDVDGNHKENPFGSQMVRTFLEKEQKESGKKKLHEGYESETAPATSSVQGFSTLGPRDNVLPDQTSSEMLELREKLKEDETPLQLRLPEHSNTGSDPILVVFCGDNQESEETSFISYIFNELCLRGFAPLRYDLARSIVTRDPEILYKSRVGIMIISMNYACSRECLDGNVAIMDHLKANDLVLIPVLFKVSVSDVMNQSDLLGRAFLQLGESPQLLKWREAMIKLTSLNGYQYMKGHEVMLAKNIVTYICLLLNFETNGIKLALESILPLLDCSQPSAPIIVGLWGMAGIGKTTITREIFRTQAERYDVCYFLPDFHLMCQTKGLSHLRDEFFSKIFGEEKVFIDACDTKLSFLRDRFLGKKILIVLDGVSNARDAEIFVGGFGWFSGGHKIILTSRNRQVLVQCKAKEIYKIPKLSESGSFRLWFDNDTEQNWKGKMSFISELVNYASGNPLALRVLVSSIQKQCIYDETQHLKRLRQHPLIEIQDAFRRSFNVVDDNEKNTFLDLACFFRGENKDRVVNILDGCGFLTDLGICGLIDESLISLVDNMIEMPNIFQDTGRFIVCQENNEAGKRSRLWDSDDIADVLTNKTGTEAIEGIFFDTSRLTLELSSTVFEKVYRLRLLKFHCQSFTSRVCLPQGLHSLPDELRLLHWERYPLGSLPRNFNPKNLVELNMPYSNMTKLWKGTKNLENLKRIILSHSRQLTEFPRLSKARDLEHIDLEGCTSLVKVNSSILHHHKLIFLSLKDCSHLRIMPTTVHLESLEVLNLSGCSELEDLQDFSPNLKELYLAGTAIKEIPLSIRDLTKLVTFDLENCSRLQHLPPEISSLKAVVTTRPKRPASSINLSSVEDMAPPCKRYRLKRVIEYVILGLRKRKQKMSVSSHKPGSAFTLVNDPAYKSFRDLLESSSQPECQSYMKTGYCKFGNDCIYLHPRNRETHLPESRSSMASETPHSNRLRVLPSFGTSSFVSDITQATVGRDTINPKPQVLLDDEIDSASSAYMSDDEIDSDSSSENYATSSWCLEELAKIMESKKTYDQVFRHGSSSFDMYNSSSERQRNLSHHKTVRTLTLTQFFQQGKRLCAFYSHTGNCSSGHTFIFDHPSLVSTHKNTFSMASETPHMNLLGIFLTLPSSELVEASTENPRIHKNTSSITSKIALSNLLGLSFALGASPSELVEASTVNPQVGFIN